MSSETKVGIFVILAVVVLSVFVFQIGGINIFNRDTYKLKVMFDFVNGVSVDAPVHVAGVAVGQVQEVSIFFNTTEQKTQVRLLLLIKDHVRVPKDSVAYISTLGILGEKYVEIVPGEDKREFLGEGDMIIGNNPVQLEKLTESLVDIVGDQTVKESLRQSFYNVREATDNLRQTTEMMQEVVASVKAGEGTIGRFVTDESIYEEAEKMIVNLNLKLDKTVTDLNEGVNSLVDDIKRRPWKLLRSGRKGPVDKKDEDKKKDPDWM